MSLFSVGYFLAAIRFARAGHTFTVMCDSYLVVRLKHICLSLYHHYTKQIPLCQEVIEKILNIFV